jgi:imidazolonepropionase-like amidohydrolase
MKFFLLFSAFIVSWSFGQLNPQNGTSQSKPAMVAFKNARIVVSSTKIVEKGTLLIEGDKIVDVGLFVLVPDAAMVIDCKGRTILPSFIETNSSVGLPKPVSAPFSLSPQLESSKSGAYYWNEAIHPEISAGQIYQIDTKANDELIKMGFGLTVTHVQDGIARGTGALVSLGSENSNKQIIRSDIAQFYSFEKGISKQTYPSSQMGSIALLRQAFYDLKWYNELKTKETNLSLSKMQESLSLPFIFQTADKWEILRASKIAKEFNFKFNYLGSGNEYMAIRQLKNSADFIVLPINFPEPFDVKDPYISRQIPLSDLKHWELAPSNPAILAQNNVQFCFSSVGQKDAESFWKNIKKAIERGLNWKEALAALTIEPARMLEMDTDFGTLEKGKKASFTIYSTDPFLEKGKILESWMLGEQKIIEVGAKHEISGKYNILIDGKRFPLEIRGKGSNLSGKIQTIRETKDLKKGKTVRDTILPKVDVQLIGEDITLQFNCDDENWKGSVNLHGKVTSKFGLFEGDGILPTGKWIQWSAIKNDKIDSDTVEEESLKMDTSYYSKMWFPNMAYGFDQKALPTVETIVFRDATVWMNEAQGVLNNATVIMSNGKITFVGTGNFSIPINAKVIDAKGKYITSGIIDEHSHIAISKGVNEGGQAISAEVSVSDVVTSDDINIYRQLSGGVTTAQLLHGSANPIGGQSALIKLKWGHSPEEMLIANAPKFIKCALGENVKQANWGDYNTVRFPQTRMGVEQVFYDGFARARKYEAEWNTFSKDNTIGTSAPRKDLELEVLLEILNSKRFITCHSYVQSEINMLMHVADSMKFKINTFTHILEGYKVADKMLKHGAGASTFSDWWAYKFEVNDAIPYNAKLLSDMGIVVAINSDDAEMGRRLNQEAAKAVKYGGMTEEEAWKMVTLNPAKLLHLDERMGSLKEGKDADIVVWTTNPLSIEAKVEMTIVDGEVLFDSKRDYLMRSHNQIERARIVSKMLESNDKGEENKPFVKRKTRHFHCDTLGEEGSIGENTH